MEQFTEKEIEALRKLVPLADGIAKEAKYQEARNLVWRHWKGLVIAVAAFIAAVALVWDKLIAGLFYLR